MTLPSPITDVKDFQSCGRRLYRPLNADVNAVKKAPVGGHHEMATTRQARMQVLHDFFCSTRALMAMVLPAYGCGAITPYDCHATSQCESVQPQQLIRQRLHHQCHLSIATMALTETWRRE